MSILLVSMTGSDAIGFWSFLLLSNKSFEGGLLQNCHQQQLDNHSAFAPDEACCDAEPVESVLYVGRHRVSYTELSGHIFHVLRIVQATDLPTGSRGIMGALGTSTRHSK